MKTHLIIHRLAILFLLVVATKNVVGSFHQVPGAPIEMKLAPLFGIAVWSLLLWKIWHRPRNWGLGVGIFLFLMIAFQSYLWWRAVNNPGLASLKLDRSLAHFVLFYELPIFLAGVFCVLLRFYYPRQIPPIHVHPL